jgi:predicted transcriptional regulator
VKINTIKDFRAFLDQTNITVTDFAALADINRSQLHSVIAGRVALSRLMRLRIQRGVDIVTNAAPKVPMPRVQVTVLAGV